MAIKVFANERGFFLHLFVLLILIATITLFTKPMIQETSIESTSFEASFSPAHSGGQSPYDLIKPSDMPVGFRKSSFKGYNGISKYYQTSKYQNLIDLRISSKTPVGHTSSFKGYKGGK